VASTIPDIFGPNGAVSSETRVQRASRGLTACLVSRLQARTCGSILYNLTWKQTVTPSGRLIWRLRASAARISDSDLCGWPTPTTPSGGQTTPPGTSATGRRPDGSKATVSLQTVAPLAGWASPAARDWKGAPDDIWGDNARPLNEQAVYAGYPSPRASDGSKNVRTLDGALSECRRKGGPQDLPSAAMLTGSTVGMAHGARLDPAHSRWLLRLPSAWDDCMVSAMQSMRKRSSNS